MGKVLDFIANKEPLKIAIMNYSEAELDVIHFSDPYWLNHRQVFKRPTEEKGVSRDEFAKRLYDYIWTPKVSEMLVILYLEELQDNNPTIYQLNRLLNRTSEHYSATFKAVKKLEALDIVYTQKDQSSNRNENRVFVNKDTVTLYGDDVFRDMMLKEWETDAKKYITWKLGWIREGKEEMQKKIKRIKKGKRG